MSYEIFYKVTGLFFNPPGILIPRYRLRSCKFVNEVGRGHLREFCSFPFLLLSVVKSNHRLYLHIPSSLKLEYPYSLQLSLDER